jgi:hypothetical protein
MKWKTVVGFENYINYLERHKHFSPFEHCYLSLIIDCPSGETTDHTFFDGPHVEKNEE